MERTDNGQFLLRPREELDYHDSRSVPLPRPISALEAWNAVMGERRPLLRMAFRIRDAISARFGVERIGGFSGQPRNSVSTGDRLDFFLVEHQAPEVLVLTARDRHLDVMTCVATGDARLTITSSVVTHNAFGRAYMLVVGPAHRLIVGRMLRQVARRLAADAGP